MKKFRLCAALFLLVLFISSPKNIYATPDGWVYGQQTVYVNGQAFDLWGYSFWDSYGNFRLRDIAYILSGTSAQFDIRQPLGDYLHFWIERNAPYAPIGGELAPFYDENIEWRTIGGFHAYAMEHFPRQSVILSIDGTDAPEGNTIVTALSSFGFPLDDLRRLTDLEQVYFDITYFASILGFGIEKTSDNQLRITTGTEFLSDNLPYQPLELLDAAFRLTGHWVDRRFFESEVITQDVAWPHEVQIGLLGLTYNFHFVDYGFTGLPLAARQPNWWHHMLTFHPFAIEFLEGGAIALYVEELNRRIIADLDSLPVNALIYYAGSEAIEMVRLDPNRSPGRYHFEALESGGVLLRYIADYQSFWHLPEYIHIYRSTVQGEYGERILSRNIISENDLMFFEFADPHAEPDVTYFYAVKVPAWQGYRALSFGGQTQMTVYMPYSPHTPDETYESPETEGSTLPAQQGTDWVTIITVTIMGIGAALAGFFIAKRMRK